MRVVYDVELLYRASGEDRIHILYIGIVAINYLVDIRTDLILSRLEGESDLEGEVVSTQGRSCRVNLQDTSNLIL